MARPENEPQTALAKRLREVRKVLGDDGRKQFAMRLGLPMNTLANYETGLREPPASVIAAYKAIYGVSFGWLLTGEGEVFDQNDNAVGISDKQRLTVAIEIVEEGLADRSVSAAKKADLILAAYDLLTEDYKNREKIIRLVRAA